MAGGGAEPAAVARPVGDTAAAGQHRQSHGPHQHTRDPEGPAAARHTGGAPLPRGGPALPLRLPLFESRVRRAGFRA